MSKLRKLRQNAHVCDFWKVKNKKLIFYWVCTIASNPFALPCPFILWRVTWSLFDARLISAKKNSWKGDVSPVVKRREQKLWIFIKLLFESALISSRWGGRRGTSGRGKVSDHEAVSADPDSETVSSSDFTSTTKSTRRSALPLSRVLKGGVSLNRLEACVYCSYIPRGYLYEHTHTRIHTQLPSPLFSLPLLLIYVVVHVSVFQGAQWVNWALLGTLLSCVSIAASLFCLGKNRPHRINDTSGGSVRAITLR